MKYHAFMIVFPVFSVCIKNCKNFHFHANNYFWQNQLLLENTENCFSKGTNWILIGSSFVDTPTVRKEFGIRIVKSWKLSFSAHFRNTVINIFHSFDRFILTVEQIWKCTYSFLQPFYPFLLMQIRRTNSETATNGQCFMHNGIELKHEQNRAEQNKQNPLSMFTSLHGLCISLYWRAGLWTCGIYLKNAEINILGKTSDLLSKSLSPSIWYLIKSCTVQLTQTMNEQQTSSQRVTNE